MNVKELKEIIKDVPDDFEVMVEFRDYSKGTCLSEKLLFSNYKQKPCTARVYTQKTLMLTEKDNI